MVHLQALPGAPGFCGDLERVIFAAHRDIIALQNGGVDGLMFENFNDVPFYPDAVPPETVAAFTAVLAHLQSVVNLPIGLNVLRNDGLSAIAIASACGAQFIRVNVLSGATVTDQGILQSQAHEIVRKKAQLAAAVKIFADVQVKHGAAIIQRPIAEEARELLDRAGADAIIVIGSMTGMAADAQDVQEIRSALPRAFILSGSGVTPIHVADCAPLVDAFIIVTFLQENGDVSALVDTVRVRKFMQRIQEFR